MGFFQPLFSVSVEHQYFSDGLWKGLDFVPEPGTLKLIECANTVVKNTRNGISVFYDAEKSGTLSLFAEDAGGALRFSFKVFAKDRSFANYTLPPVQKEGAILYFANSVAGGGASGTTIKLSKGDFVSELDFEYLAALDAGGFPCANGRRRPDFVVDIFIASAESGGLVAREYGVNFGARRSYLKYHLLGSMNRDNLFIFDLDNQVEFEFCGDVMLSGNNPAKVFRSKTLIPVLERSDSRFQLRERGQGAGKVLIKRLPVASENRLGLELINGKNEIISESFINC